MKKLAALALLLVSVEAVALPRVSFREMAENVMDDVFQRMSRCGLEAVPTDRNLALKAVVTQSGRVVAYYNEEYGFGARFLFKNPQGGSVHSVAFNREEIRFKTPYQGVVAHVNTYRTPGGIRYRGYCRSRPLDHWDQFHACVETRFTRVLVNRLCQS